MGDNDVPLTLADLKNGQRVEVKGEQRDGFVYAVRIHINGLTGRSRRRMTRRRSKEP